jgi:Domain of unknown function (DUF3854)
VTSYPNTSSRTLSDAHRRMLFEESGIDPAVAEERGYRSVERRTELTEYPEWQRRLGLYIPTYSPDGETTGCLLRPNRPRKESLKYEAPQGSGVSVDVHPRAREEVRTGDGDLFVVEGVKKADALVSRGVAAVALAGVWMAHVPKSKPKKPLPCWDHVRIKGRRVFVIYDSDWKRNDTVHAALEWLVGALEERGADVRVAYLEDNPDGSKVGADDYLVSGGTVAELKALCRRFERQDVARIRLSKDAKLRALVEDLQRRWWDERWSGRGGYTDRDVAYVLIQAAARSGKIHRDGIRVCVSWGRLQVESKISRQTLAKALARLEVRGFLYRDNKGRKADKTGAFVLRARVDHVGKKPRPEDNDTQGRKTRVSERFDPSSLPLRAPISSLEVPRLRWSRPKWKPGRETRRKYRLGEISRLPETRDRIERLGKIRGAVVDALCSAGGTLSLKELCVILRRKRVRDLRRRNLPMLVEAGIISVDGDEYVSLTEAWSDRLEDARRLGGEIEADELAERRRKLKSQAFHRSRDSSGAAESSAEPTAASVEAIRRNRAAREKGMAEERRRQEARTEPTEEERRVRRLVHEGMSERWARGSGVGLAPSPTKPKSPTSVSLVDSIYVHGQECDCEWCVA